MHSPACHDDDCHIPDGRCHCGCGRRTAIAAKTEHRKDRVVGHPHQYARGHNPRPVRDERYVVDGDGCWVWSLALDRHGYGQWSVDGVNRLAHRVMYERVVGRIPTGLTLDHLCRVRACVNPAHLEPVTAAENMRRARGGASAPR